MPKDIEHAEFFAHFPRNVTIAIADYATNTALLSSRYLFVRRHKRTGLQFGYCTHCRREYITNGSLKHNESTQCEKCKSLVIVKGDGMGRKYLRDDAYFVWYEKSVVNPEAIVARGFYVQRSYSGNYHNVETEFKTAAMYLFEPCKDEKQGYSKMLRRTTYFSGYFGNGATLEWHKEWMQPKSIMTEFEHSMKNKSRFLAVESVASAVHGTPFQYTMWGHYVDLNDDLVQFFDLTTRYKCIEFLTKVGLGSTVVAKLTGQATYGAINWNGKTPEKVLRLTKSEIKEMRKLGAIGPRALRHYQTCKKEGSNLDWESARAMSDLLDSYYSGQLKKLAKYATMNEIKRYFAKQMRREGSRYTSGSDVLTAWRDYLRECEELGVDTCQQHILFPNDLYAAHTKTSSKIKVKADKELNAKITKRLKELQKYTFEHNDFILRPANSSIELFQEGKQLKHCVGGYAERYADGSTNIFLIRKACDPETPFYTMEVIIGQNLAKITQCQGYKHCDPTEDVQAFIDAWTAKKLITKKRTRVAQPA